jgi:pyridoxal phosphate enzyme (YggS family)
MHNTVKNLLDINNNIEVYLNRLNINSRPKIIAVSKTFKIEKILPLMEYGHIDFGENKVQEASEKWMDIKKNNLQVKLHMIGKLQTNKVKYAVRIFDYIHSVDSAKLAKKIVDEQNKINKKIKVFLQINIGDEDQMVAYCKEIGLDLIGLMCIPPANVDPNNYFEEMSRLNKSFGFEDLSMGMSSDYLIAAKHFATYVRVGSSIFGHRN